MRVCAPAMLHLCVPCCDFTVSLVPPWANFTLLAPPTGVSAGGGKGEMPWGKGRERWFLMWVALSYQPECVCERVREKVSMRELGLELTLHVHIRKEKRDEERSENEIGTSAKYNLREEREGRDFMPTAQSKDSM